MDLNWPSCDRFSFLWPNSINIEQYTFNPHTKVCFKKLWILPTLQPSHVQCTHFHPCMFTPVYLGFGGPRSEWPTPQRAIPDPCGMWAPGRRVRLQDCSRDHQPLSTGYKACWTSKVLVVMVRFYSTYSDFSNLFVECLGITVKWVSLTGEMNIKFLQYICTSMNDVCLL